MSCSFLLRKKPEDIALNKKGNQNHTLITSVLAKRINHVEIIYTSDKPSLQTIFDGGFSVPEKTSISFYYMLGIDNDEKQMHLIALLKQSKGFHRVPRSTLGVTGYVFLVDKDYFGSPPSAYVYFPQTGELGLGKDWCDVPPEFRQWMKTLKPGVSVPVPTPETRSGINVNGTFIPND